jgi:hypothetical protein
MAGNTLHGTGRVHLDDEMRAFDMLGPLSRAALNEARFQIGAASLVRGLVAAGVQPDRFKEPTVDRAGVRCVHDLDCKLAYRFAVEEGTA